MYSQIFEDFNVIKQHCDRNGNGAFEESLVFDLLEQFFPRYGSQRSIQKVLDMLDAQRIREVLNNQLEENIVDNEVNVKVKDEAETEDVDKTSVEAYNSESNDADSIIEVVVPKKTFPVIDLTNNSPDSIIIEETLSNTLNKDEESDDNSLINDSDDNHSNASYNYDQNSSDLDIERHVNNDYTDEKFFPKDPPLFDLLADLNDTLDQIPNAVEVPEILEENNNDPNNNLEGAIFEEPMNIDNTMYRNNREITETFGNSNSNNSVIVEEMIDSIPGCSKDTDRDTINRIFGVKKSLPKVHSPISPVPGCSKDFPQIINSSESSDSDDGAFDYDDSIQNDAVCIQEIIPWAKKKVILKLLRQNGKEDKRKEITLWKLMEKQTNNSDKKIKRKRTKSPCSTQESSPKKLKSYGDVNDRSLEEISSNEFLNEQVSSNELVKFEPNLETTSDNENNQSAVISDLNNDQTSKTLPKIPDFKYLKLFQKDVFPINPTSSSSSSSSSSNKISETIKSKPPTLFGKKIIFSSKSLNSNNVNNDFNDELNLISEYIGVENSKDEQSQSSSKVIPNPLFKGGEINNPPIRIPQPGGSGLKTKSSSNVIRPSKLTLSPKATTAGSEQLPRIHTIVHRARLNFPDMTQSNRKVPSYSLSQESIEKIFGIESEKPKEEKPVVLPSKTPLWPLAFRAFQEANNRIEAEQRLIRSSMFKNDPVPLREMRPFEAGKIHSVTHTATRTVNAQPVATVPHTATRNVNAQPVATVTHTATRTVNAQPVMTSANVDLTALPLVPPLAPPFLPTPELVQIIRDVTSSIRSQTPRPVTAAQPTTSGTASVSNAEVQNFKVPQSIYVKLRSMFPEIAKGYIKAICAKPPLPMHSGDSQMILNFLVDHLLKVGKYHLETQQIHDVPDDTMSSLTVDEKYEYLIGIFPNADPTYLREFVEKETTTDQAIEDFIQQKIEKHDYPTKQDYLNKIKVTEQIRQYTTNFNVENFLELFPDPIKHFEDDKRQNNYDLIAMEFLKSVFNRHKVCTINKMYRSNKYNLSLTAKLLSSLTVDMKSKRCNCEMLTENIPLLQEIAFVKNKKKILDHMENIKKQEEALFKDLKEKNLLLTCLCCYNEECMPTKSSECNAGHVFCHECIIRGTQAALADGSANVHCFTDCESDFSLTVLQKVLPPTQFSSLLVKRQAAEVAAAAVEGLVSCPFCYFASIPPPEDKVFKCLNPDCMKESCRLCKELNHVPLRCDEVVKIDKARLLIEEKMTEALLRTCYQCKKQFYKEEGCNKMRCNCGALMCYVCDSPVKGYDHFNAQGGANSRLCPLWSDDRRLNAESVRKVAEDVKNNILKQNPNLKIDTESLLPSLPPKSRGPHDDIPNANQLHEHVRRVANGP